MLLADAAQIRQADNTMTQALGFPSLLLMETAGRKAADCIRSRWPSQKLYLVLAGPGNNGGDGLVIARHLHSAGLPVHILFSNSPDMLGGDAALNYKALQGSKIPMTVWPTLPEGGMEGLPASTLIVDALLGTGSRSILRGVVAEVIEAFRDLPFPVVATDLPSGLDAGTGMAPNVPLKAALTVTFQLPKLCHYVYPAAGYCGEIVVADIGVWPEVIAGLGIRRTVTDGAMLRAWYQPRPKAGHKGDFGHAAILGGSGNYAGAAALAAHAALHIGCGLSTAYVPEAARMAVHALGPEVIVHTQAGDILGPAALIGLEDFLKNKEALAVGPGLGTGPDQAAFLRGVLEACKVPLVLDADALNLLAAHPDLWKVVPPGTVLTPHPGEMRRLIGQDETPGLRIELAEEFAQDKGVVLLLKGAGTIIAGPNGRTWVNPTGNPGMATGGAGDVLTGIIVGLLAQGYLAPEATAMAVYLHGLAGDLCAAKIGLEGTTARTILHELGPALNVVLHHLEPPLQQI